MSLPKKMRSMCGCGTYHEAFTIGAKDHTKWMETDDCVIWRIAILSAQTRLLQCDFLRSEVEIKGRTPQAALIDWNALLESVIADCVESNPDPDVEKVIRDHIAVMFPNLKESMN